MGEIQPLSYHWCASYHLTPSSSLLLLTYWSPSNPMPFGASCPDAIIKLRHWLRQPHHTSQTMAWQSIDIFSTTRGYTKLINISFASSNHGR